jgi:hypothetical protein
MLETSRGQQGDVAFLNAYPYHWRKFGCAQMYALTNAITSANTANIIGESTSTKVSKKPRTRRMKGKKKRF